MGAVKDALISEYAAEDVGLLRSERDYYAGEVERIQGELNVLLRGISALPHMERTGQTTTPGATRDYLYKAVAFLFDNAIWRSGNLPADDSTHFDSMCEDARLVLREFIREVYRGYTPKQATSR